jgi:hypothetical protein
METLSYEWRGKKWKWVILKRGEELLENNKIRKNNKNFSPENLILIKPYFVALNKK